jgi:hypothetical protein
MRWRKKHNLSERDHVSLPWKRCVQLRRHNIYFPKRNKHIFTNWFSSVTYLFHLDFKELICWKHKTASCTSKEAETVLLVHHHHGKASSSHKFVGRSKEATVTCQVSTVGRVARLSTASHLQTGRCQEQLTFLHILVVFVLMSSRTLFLRFASDPTLVWQCAHKNIIKVIKSWWMKLEGHAACTREISLKKFNWKIVMDATNLQTPV